MVNMKPIDEIEFDLLPKVGVKHVGMKESNIPIYIVYDTDTGEAIGTFTRDNMLPPES